MQERERERAGWSMKVWNENKLAWEKARDRYFTKERLIERV